MTPAEEPAAERADGSGFIPALRVAVRDRLRTPTGTYEIITGDR